MKDWRVWLVGGAGVLALLLSAFNVSMHQRNHALQSEVAAQQQRINEGVRLSQFNTQFVRLLASVAAQTGDPDINRILTHHGISFTVSEPASSEQAVKPDR